MGLVPQKVQIIMYSMGNATHNAHVKQTGLEL